MEILYNAALNFAQTIFNPFVILGLIIFGINIHRSNIKTSKIQNIFLLGEGENPLSLTLSSFVFAFIFGFVAIIMYDYILGDINLAGEIFILLTVSFISKNISQRYICFAYSGSIVCMCLLSMATVMDSLRIPHDFYTRVVNIILLVSIMHFIEGFLVFFDGARGFSYYSIKRGNKIIGGFKFSRRWLVPLPALFSYVGFSSITYTMTKKRKIIDSSLRLIIYAIILYICTLIFREGLYLNLLLVLIMFLGHEFVTKSMFFKEIESKEIFVSDSGISVLDSIKTGKARKAGIVSRDLITHINGAKTNDFNYLLKLFSNGIHDFTFNVKKYNGKLEKYQLKLESIAELGMVMVPAAKPFTSDISFSNMLDEVMSS